MRFTVRIYGHLSCGRNGIVFGYVKRAIYGSPIYPLAIKFLKLVPPLHNLTWYFYVRTGTSIGIHIRVQPQTLKYVYLGFLGSILGRSKHVWPFHEPPGDIYLSPLYHSSTGMTPPNTLYNIMILVLGAHSNHGLHELRFRSFEACKPC